MATQAELLDQLRLDIMAQFEIVNAKLDEINAKLDEAASSPGPGDTQSTKAKAHHG